VNWHSVARSWKQIARPFTQSAYTKLVDADAGGTAGNGIAAAPSMSADGHFVAFSSGATNLIPNQTYHGSTFVYVKNMQSGEVIAASKCSSGTICAGQDPAISADGRHLAFTSTDQILTSDTNGLADIYEVDLTQPSAITL